ncbi:MAG: exodeoxyribonuclease VII large subunit [Saprospirales bacterium]|nr:MAG: exodeoxyribonuclease VII large subunit [Saprospirales bacterium]
MEQGFENTDSEAKKAIPLYELNQRIKRAISVNFPQQLWVRAEIASISTKSRHRYLQLVEKQEQSDRVKAKAFAVLWAGNYLVLKKRLGGQLDEVLKEGLELLIAVKVDFHEEYGLKLNIVDADPGFTIGKYFSRKQQIFNEIRKKGLDKLQPTLPLPYVLQSIAVISSSGAAGYRDFMAQINATESIMDIRTELLDCHMQGVRVEADMLSALSKINQSAKKWDAVVIIRGGGSRLDLSDFDNLKLAEVIAKLPVPVLSGIGHEIDMSAIDLVAHQALKTPTAAAQFIIDHNIDFINRLLTARETILQTAVAKLKDHHYQLRELNREIIHRAGRPLSEELYKLREMTGRIKLLTTQIYRSEEERLKNIERELKLSSPEAIMKRGFSIAAKDGKVIRFAEETEKGDELTIKLYRGKIRAINQGN